MSIELEYAVKKDIRNTGVVRTADARQRRELRRIVVVAGLVVAMLLFSAWQHFGRLEATKRVEQLRTEYARERVLNRQLRLNLEARRSPEALEPRASQLGMRRPTLSETLVIERIQQPATTSSVVAIAR